MASRPSTLIIGAGNFGASTALSLIQRDDVGKVTLLDSAPFPNPRAASHDINKIVRDDYADPLYMSIMVEGMKHWRNNPLYSKFYHQTGAMRADPGGFSSGSLATYKTLGVDTNAGWISIEEGRSRWSGVFSTSNFDGLERLFFNPKGGWAEGKEALSAVIQAALDKGVEYNSRGAAKLLFDSNGICTGALLNDGTEILAENVVVAAGAATAQLLYNSDPDNKNLHVGERAVATGAMSFFGKWDDEKREKFKDVPVLKSSVPGIKGEAMSLLDDGTVKFNCDMCFTNTQKQPDGSLLSVPPSDAKQFTWTDNVPQTLKDIAQKTMRGLYGDVADGVKVEGYRLCWDASTPTHDFLITPHPHRKNLYIATGGSFHGWKFLPVIGDLIVKMIKGELEHEKAVRWAWDKDPNFETKMASPSYTTSGDLVDLMK